MPKRPDVGRFVVATARSRSHGTSRPIGLHEARHTCASTVIAAGVDAKGKSSYLGHASITITLDRCGHLMPGNEDEAVKLDDRYLEGAGDATRGEAAGAEGLEPPAYGFGDRRSTN